MPGREARLEELSIRALAECHRGAPPHGAAGAATAAPPARKQRVFAALKLDAAKPLIDAMLTTEQAFVPQTHPPGEQTCSRKVLSANPYSPFQSNALTCPTATASRRAELPSG